MRLLRGNYARKNGQIMQNYAKLCNLCICYIRTKKKIHINIGTNMGELKFLRSFKHVKSFS